MLNDPTRNNQTDSEYGIVYRKSIREQWNRMRSCCFITSGVPLVKYETEPFTQRACMQRPKKKTIPDWQVAGLIGKGTYLVGLS